MNIKRSSDNAIWAALEQRDAMEQRAVKAERERDMWKANHDNQVSLKRAIMDRPDMGDRAKRVVELQERAEKAERERDELLAACRSYFIDGSTTIQEHMDVRGRLIDAITRITGGKKP